MKLLLSQRIMCTPYNYTPCQSHICRVLQHVCLAVTCHLHFWQNDQALSCYCNTMGDTEIRVSTESWPGDENFLPLLPRPKPATFRSWVQHSDHWAIPAPHICSIHTDVTLLPILCALHQTHACSNSNASATKPMVFALSHISVPIPGPISPKPPVYIWWRKGAPTKQWITDKYGHELTADKAPGPGYPGIQQGLQDGRALRTCWLHSLPYSTDSLHIWKQATGL